MKKIIEAGLIKLPHKITTETKTRSRGVNIKNQPIYLPTVNTQPYFRRTYKHTSFCNF